MVNQDAMKLITQHITKTQPDRVRQASWLLIVAAVTGFWGVIAFLASQML